MNNNLWQNKQVLVTGAGGFIGSHLVKRLVTLGASVHAFVRYNSRGDPGLLRLLPLDILQNVQIIAGDLRDVQAVQNAVHGSEYVFHLGALISIPYSYLHPSEVTETNILGSFNVLAACRNSRVVKLIHTSSSEVYGTAKYAPIDELHPLQGQSPYSASKIGADKLAESFHCAYGLPVVTVRPFNTYGPHQSARAIIPAIVTQALTGDTIHVGNLQTSRDFTYVEDTVTGFLCAAQSENTAGMTLNLGTGSEIKIGDLVHKILTMIGSRANVMMDKERLRPNASEVYRLISDNRLAHRVMGWSPETSLEQGLERTIAWISHHLDLYRPGAYEF